MSKSIKVQWLVDEKDNGWDDWCIRHNDALALPWNDEFAIMQLAQGIADWCTEERTDGFSRPNIVWPLVCAFRDALNYDLGRLDGGTLDKWTHDLCTELDINPDTGEWK